MHKKGFVYLVGAGCGSADLITVRGLRLLQSCDAVVYDALIDPALLAQAAHAEQHPAGKRCGRHSMPQSEINSLLVRLGQSGKTVVRLKGGDFSGNSSAAGSQYDGLFLKPYNKNLTAEVHIAKLNQDLTVWTNQTSKTVNNTWLVLESPLTHKVILNDSYRIADTIVVKGTDSYTLTESDLANLIPGDDAIAFYLDAENNAIRIRTVE